MKIGMWSDSVNFPNLPLMKLSAYHKARGDQVELINDSSKQYDKVYLSKVFNLPLVRKIPGPPEMVHAKEIESGGTGYAISVQDGIEIFNPAEHHVLPDNIEHLYPDYSLYPEYQKTAYGFLTRGCCNSCSFCLVSSKEGNRSIQVASLSEFWRGQREIKLLDPNLLACSDRERLLESLAESKACIDFTQGLDARFITEDIAKLINKSRIKTVHFAFDFMKHEKQICKGLEHLSVFMTARTVA